MITGEEPFDPARISITDYDYTLPESSIAQYPAEVRDASRLLVFDGEHPGEDLFLNIGNHLPSDGILVFNDTKVIRSRLVFHKSSGARIEVFCLEPLAPVTEPATAFLQTSGVEWSCLIGNLKRWKSEPLVMTHEVEGVHYQLNAEKIGPGAEGTYVVRFTWTPPETTFSRILEVAGLIPLPPYIHRMPDASDPERYQTIFAKYEGSVAAPTAGLHFTERVLEGLSKKGVKTQRVTLHVGAGTFKPVTTREIGGHVMHQERISVDIDTIDFLADHPDQPVIAVGTTSARTLESLYWLGSSLLISGGGPPEQVTQWMPYEAGRDIHASRNEALKALADYLRHQGLRQYEGETRLMIVPGYRFRVVDGLVTNFHIPQSTLLLLVAALTGPGWRDAYSFALSRHFRFLSYGDACLLFNRLWAKKQEPGSFY